MKKFLLPLFAFAAVTAGAQETVYFSEDFEGLEPWTSVGDANGPAGDVMTDNKEDNNAPNLTLKADINGTQVTAVQALRSKGFEFTAYHHTSKSERTPEKQIYLQRNYLKFGLTGYQSGIILPAVEVPAGTKAVLSFDMCSQRKGNGTWDPIEIVVTVKNGEDVTTMDVPYTLLEEDAAFEWTRIEMPLNDLTINKDTKIIIENGEKQQGVSTAQRWYLDNLKLASDPAGIENVAADNQDAVYYNLQGVRVENPTKGLYIKRQGNKATKVVL